MSGTFGIPMRIDGVAEINQGLINIQRSLSDLFQRLSDLPISSGILGTTTNDNAAAGYVGEFVFSDVSGSPVSLMSGTVANVTSIPLTAGDWDVSGNIVFVSDPTTVTTTVGGGIGLTSATYVNTPGAGVAFSLPFPVGTNVGFPVGISRISLASTTPVYLFAEAVFTTAALRVEGFIGARRVR